MCPQLIGLITHAGKPGARQLTADVREEFARRNIPLLLERATAELLGEHSGCTIADLSARADLLVVLGGDGTILNVARNMDGNMRPIFGINLGTLGFLTCLGSSDFARAVECVAAGSYVLSKRSMLAVEVEQEGQVKFTGTGLNDAVISRGGASRLIKLQTRVDGALLAEYNADGLILSTPTGSTAYSLAAGGPILAPDSGVFLVTPICPHVLTNRSVILPDHEVIEVQMSYDAGEVFLNVDGHQVFELQVKDVVRIRRSPHELPLASLPEISFFEVLQQKLKWSGTNV